jgi:hypothetical protein
MGCPAYRAHGLFVQTGVQSKASQCHDVTAQVREMHCNGGGLHTGAVPRRGFDDALGGEEGHNCSFSVMSLAGELLTNTELPVDVDVRCASRDLTKTLSDKFSQQTYPT